MSTSHQHIAQNKAVATRARVPAAVLQRTCACGSHTGGAGECESCKKKTEGQLQRRASSNALLRHEPTTAPEIVHEVLQSPGRPLDRETRTFMESRFGHDFSGVRVHTDEKAASSASAVAADAYTVGHKIVFGHGLYVPSTATGRRLIAHELTHVVQQRGARVPSSGGLQIGSATDRSEHEAEQAADIVTATATQATGVLKPQVLADTTVAPPLRRRNIFDAIAGLFKGDTFTEAELQTYLTKLDTTKRIEDYNESDNKARAIVHAWRRGGSPYVLTAQRKILLIKEMQSGFTGDDDEQAILEILERSYTGELSMIFAAIGVADLNSDFHGSEWTDLQGFYGRRFEGGMAAMLKGQIKPKGLPVTLGVDLTKSHQLANNLLPGAVTDWNIPCVLGILCSQDRGVVAQLPLLTIKTADKIFYDNPFYDGAHWTTRRFEAAGIFNRNQHLMMILRGDDCADVADTFFHEVRHLNQPPGMDVVTEETDAYLTTERWSISRGLPGNPNFRKTDPHTGNVVADPVRIEQKVRDDYAGVSAVPGEKVIGKTGAGHTKIRRPNGTTYTRPPHAGDTFQGPRQVSNQATIAPASWVCPPV
jgi:Domain of unknown function (DUF4157)